MQKALETMKKIKENTVQPTLASEETPKEDIKVEVKEEVKQENNVEEVNVETQGTENKKEEIISTTTENIDDSQFPF